LQSRLPWIFAEEKNWLVFNRLSQNTSSLTLSFVDDCWRYSRGGSEIRIMPSHVLLPGSYLEHPANSKSAGDVADETIHISLVLRRKDEPQACFSLLPRLSREEFADIHGADMADVDAVRRFAAEIGVEVVRVDEAARTVTLSGSLEILRKAFGADVELRQAGSETFRSRQGSLHLPEALRDRVVSVFGFDQRPHATTYRCAQPRAASGQSYTPRDLAKIYNFPANSGKGQTIAIIELGGGYTDAELNRYWKQLGLLAVSTKAVSVDNGRNAPLGDPNGPDGEVLLDIEVAGGVAPGADLVVYFAANTEQGFLNAINAAIHDKTHRPSVISISWGAPESTWSKQALNAYNAALNDAAMLGVSVCVASGDNGSSDGMTDGAAHVDFPASSPWVLACGGTSLIAKNWQIVSETVWNDSVGGATGGGVSSVFPRPDYQTGSPVPPPGKSLENKTGRGVPDVCAVADPRTGYQVLVDGQSSVIGGTSAVAPLWAGLLALLNEQLGKNLGWFHPLLYGTIAQHKALNDVVSGTNGDYKAGKTWDPCTGLGSPNGQAILNVLKTVKS
jgi:kumamolisin